MRRPLNRLVKGVAGRELVHAQHDLIMFEVNFQYLVDRLSQFRQVIQCRGKQPPLELEAHVRDHNDQP